MDLSAAQHQLHHHFHHQQQEMGSHSDPQSLDSVIAGSKPAQSQQQQEKKPRPPDNEPQKCPRCDSTNTKFCYYNNYSLTQPRYFCKSCRRYWTKGGTLRNVPVGGGCRKNKRCSSSASSAASSPSHSPASFSSSLIKRAHGQDMVAMAGSASNPLFSGLHLPAFSSASSYGGGLGLGFDVMGNASVTDCDGVLAHTHNGSFLDSIRSGAFLDHHNNGGLFQNLCYGFGIGNETGGGGNSNCVSGISEDMGVMPYEDVVSTGGGGSSATTTAVTVTTMKQESSENRALWGFPWQMNGDHGSLGAGLAGPGADLEPIRESWNGLIGNSTWGLLNSPALM